MELKTDGLIYSCGDLMIFPYPPETALAYLYSIFEKQGLLPILFHEGVPPLSWFLSTYRKPEISTLGCYRKLEDGTAEILGIVWINQSWKIGQNWTKREVGMCFVRQQPIQDLETLALMSIQWAFDHLNTDTLVGTTPETNRAALLFGRKLGFHQAGPLPGYTCYDGKLCGAYFQSLPKDEWRSRGVFHSNIEKEEHVGA